MFWYPEFLLSPFLFVKCTSPSRLVASIIRHGSWWNMTWTQAYIGIARSGVAIGSQRWDTPSLRELLSVVSSYPSYRLKSTMHEQNEAWSLRSANPQSAMTSCAVSLAHWNTVWLVFSVVRSDGYSITLSVVCFNIFTFWGGDLPRNRSPRASQNAELSWSFRNPIWRWRSWTDQGQQ